ncbi:hypothetical protein [Streptacidiphilus fuscans]|uniref:hypothetical protein n=1 Tax=Streptacidiphilus fuscans TaxID=2789292 RepID=UPI001F3E46D3|nr:hypothetical protein [Streptacidiphilus fuscans]
MSLPKTLADDVAKNLVMVARLLDSEPEQAYAYSRVALRLASRVAAVREAAGFASYVTERYSEALTEFRAARRMTGSADLWPVMADCERGLGRPERALEMAGAPEVKQLDKAGQVEMRLVAAGARADMGQHEAAVVTLESPELASNSVQPWTARLRYAYADALLAVDRETEARDWFAKAVEADQNGMTDAAERLAKMDGIEFIDALEDEAGDDEALADAMAEDADEAADRSDDDDDDDDITGDLGPSDVEAVEAVEAADAAEDDAADEQKTEILEIGNAVDADEVAAEGEGMFAEGSGEDYYEDDDEEDDEEGYGRR